MKNYTLLIPSILALIFSVILFLKAKYKLNRYSILSGYLGLFFLVLFSMFLISFYTESSNNIINLFSLLFYVAIITIPPTFFFYVLSLSDLKNQLKSINSIRHYILPIVLLFINIISFIYLKDIEDYEKSEITLITHYLMSYSNILALIFIFPLQNIYYIYKTVKHYKKHQNEIKNVFAFNTGIDLKWMQQYIIGYIVFIGIVFIIQAYNELFSLKLVTSSFMTIYLLYIGYNGLTQKKVLFYQVEDSSQNNKELKKELLKDSILSIINKDEPYLNSNLTIYEFSKLVGSNSKYVSNILNSEFEQNFATFINFYRIKKAKELLIGEKSSKYTIEVISEMVGFNSKSVFNKAFKSFVGMTPSKYKDTQKKTNNRLIE